LFIGDSKSKYYWVNREVFVLKKGILRRKRGEGKPARRVVPKKFREQVVKLYHDPPPPSWTSGHRKDSREGEV
jgi:hypothetical protein